MKLWVTYLHVLNFVMYDIHLPWCRGDYLVIKHFLISVSYQVNVISIEIRNGKVWGERRFAAPGQVLYLAVHCCVYHFSRVALLGIHHISCLSIYSNLASE